MTLAELRRMTLRRAGDLAFRELGSDNSVEADDPTICTLADLDEEINAAYEEAVNVLEQANADLTFLYEDVSYAAGVDEKDLSSALTRTPRYVESIKWYPDNNTSNEPLPVETPFMGNRKRAESYATSYWNGYPASGTGRPFVYLDGYTLGIIGKDIPATTLQVGYAPVITALSDASDTPDLVPVQFHQYIATVAAVNLLAGEDGAPQWLINRMAKLEDQMVARPRTRLNRYSTRVPGAWTPRY